MKWIAALALLALATAAQAAPQTPKAMVQDVYRRLIDASVHDKGYEPPDSFYSPRLKRLAADARTAAGGDVPCGLDFDIWFDGQEYDMTHADVAELPGSTATKQTIEARFVSLKEAHDMRFTFRRIAGRWRLDDAEAVLGHRWVFSKLLQCKEVP
ncbi:MAG TPA: hypothetical protein VGI95_06160 [Caulobacteraceae bacterium]|jgi:hypothetical protein